jgi:YD repeat-containing protein
VDLINPLTNADTEALGDGWSFGNMERLWYISGSGAIVEEPGALSLWFAQSGSTFTSPAGDFSTLTQSGTTFQRTLVDGTKINFAQSAITTSYYQESTEVDRNSNITTFAYDTNSTDTNYGALVSIADFDGQVTTLSYTGHFVTRITDPANRVTTLAHDGSGRLTSITDPAPGGGATTPQTAFGYDSSDRITTLTDPRGGGTTLAYTSGRVTTVTRADNVTEALSPYQLQGLGNPSSPVLAAQAQAQYTDGLGNNWITQLDALGFGRATQQQNPRTDVTAMSVRFRDRNGLIYLDTDPLGRHTGYQYDSKGRLTQIGLPDDTNQVSYTYADSANNPNFDQPSTYIDATGQTTSYSYDGNGNLVQITQPPVLNPDDMNHLDSPVTTITYWSAVNGRPGGLVQSVEDPLAHTTSYGYQATTPQDLLVVITYPYEAALLASPFVTMSYDSAGNLASRTDQRGYVTSWTYDALDRLTALQLPVSSGPAELFTYAYDAASNLTKLITPLPTTWTWSYDALNRQISATDGLGHTTTSAYDAAGNRVTVQDPLTHVTSYLYDPAHDLVGITDALSHTTSYAFDAAGQRVSTEDALTNVTSYSYNSRGWVSAITTPLTDQTTFAYDAVGDTTAITEYDHANSLNTATSTMAYDALHRETVYTDADSVTTTFIYDLAGNLREANGPNPPPLPATGGGCGCGVKDFGYNEANQRTSQTDSMSHTTSFGYDRAGNRVTTEDPSGNVTTLAFDPQNRVTSITAPPTGTPPTGGEVTSFSYDLVGRLSSVEDPDLNTTSYSYDNANRRVTVTDPTGKATSYSYDNADRLTSITDRRNDTRTFTYDAANRLTNEGWTNGNYSASYGYDAANRLTSAADTNSAYTYAYDSSNRLTGAGQTANSFTPAVLLSYGYDGLNNRTSLSDNLSTGDLITYTYDPDHHLTGAAWNIANSPKAQVTLGYDTRNRLTRIDRTATSSGAVDISTTIGYNADDLVTTITNYHGLLLLGTLSYDYDSNSRVSTSTGPEGSRSYGYDATNQLTVVYGANSLSITYDSNGNRTVYDNSTWTTTVGNRLTSDGVHL